MNSVKKILGILVVCLLLSSCGHECLSSAAINDLRSLSSSDSIGITCSENLYKVDIYECKYRDSTDRAQLSTVLLIELYNAVQERKRNLSYTSEFSVDFVDSNDGYSMPLSTLSEHVRIKKNLDLIIAELFKGQNIKQSNLFPSNCGEIRTQVQADELIQSSSSMADVSFTGFIDMEVELCSTPVNVTAYLFFLPKFEKRLWFYVAKEESNTRVVSSLIL